MDKIAKAVTAALVAGYAVYEAVEGSGVTSGEWVKIVVFTVLAGFSVYLVPNDTTPTVESK